MTGLAPPAGPATVPAMRLDVELVSDDRGLADLEDAWDALLAGTPEASGFQSFAWMSSCWASLV